MNNKMCPFECVTRIKPDLSKLRIFGCAAYAFIDPSRRIGKLANRAKLYMYVGNDGESNGYLLYNRVGRDNNSRHCKIRRKRGHVWQSAKHTRPNIRLQLQSNNKYTSMLYLCKRLQWFQGKNPRHHVYNNTKYLQIYGLVQFNRGNKIVWANAECYSEVHNIVQQIWKAYFPSFATERTKRK